MDEPTALKVVNDRLAKIEALNGDLRALIHVDPVHARDQAACLDSSKLDQGPSSAPHSLRKT
jgi:Asp-tRNA(Asn)/Glu-tRNA(Gln) amidotransferase A subunit family amidase